MSLLHSDRRALVLLMHRFGTEAFRSLLLPLVDFLSHRLVLPTGVVIVVWFFSFFVFCYFKWHWYCGFSVLESLMEQMFYGFFRRQF